METMWAEKESSGIGEIRPQKKTTDSEYEGFN